jgi:predicted transcriptional regulator
VAYLHSEPEIAARLKITQQAVSKLLQKAQASIKRIIGNISDEP